LTPAQRAVFDLLMQGRKTAEIARVLGRSTYTVRNHVKAIFKIFGVSSRPALIVRALGAGSCLAAESSFWAAAPNGSYRWSAKQAEPMIYRDGSGQLS
jgi:DNA-binding CsgD family transcriptional regulator